MKNPIALADPLINSTKEFYADPYPALKRLREESPVFWSEKGQYWLITRYADAHDILSDLHFEKAERKYKSVDMLARILPQSKMQSRGRHMLNSNPPDHTRMRGLVNKAFTPKRISELNIHIEKIANELLDEVQAKGRMDLMQDFAFPLPAIVISELLGLPTKDRNKLKSWSHAMTAALDPNPDIRLIDMAKVMLAFDELQKYLEPFIEERRKEKRDDLISALVAAEEAGDRLSTAELLSNLVLLFLAGHETTTNLIGNGTLLFLTHPQELARLKADMNLMPSAVSECLRYQSPAQIVRRIASVDAELGGQKIASGQHILILIGAANRDPQEFPDPDVFDIARSPNKHLSFGHGIHHCLGSSLAETEGQIAFRTLFTRFPNLTLATDHWEYKHPFSLRGLKELPVKF